MTNRERYILNQAPYDLMLAIERNTGTCPIRAVAGISRDEKIRLCSICAENECEQCVMEWLNGGYERVRE